MISFIIPALNEAGNIVDAIRSIKVAMGSEPCEVIVADNGSTDDTVTLAGQEGAVTVQDRTKTIGGLRNLGVEKAIGDILVFMDADVRLDANWYSQLLQAKQDWPANGLIVTGSTCRVPTGASFIEKNWFHKLQNAQTSYINSGHLITTRTQFSAISGFDERLATAEDYDFCQRAEAAGGRVRKAPDIQAFHLGYPGTIPAFIAREAWHGRDDVASFAKLTRSKVALVALFNAVVILTGILLLMLQGPESGMIVLSLSLILVVLLTVKKFGLDRPLSIMKTALCFELYLLGRSLSYFYKKDRPAARS